MRIIGTTETLIEELKSRKGEWVLMPKATRQQENRLWKVIRIIARETAQTTDEVYGAILTLAEVGSEMIECDPFKEPELREEYRCVVLRQKGKRNLYQCFYGVSKLSTDEAGLLIDIAQQTLDELGIEDGILYHA